MRKTLTIPSLQPLESSGHHRFSFVVIINIILKLSKSHPCNNQLFGWNTDKFPPSGSWTWKGKGWSSTNLSWCQWMVMLIVIKTNYSRPLDWARISKLPCKIESLKSSKSINSSLEKVRNSSLIMITFFLFGWEGHQPSILTYVSFTVRWSRPMTPRTIDYSHKNHNPESLTGWKLAQGQFWCENANYFAPHKNLSISWFW